jgi:pimeloyl-ACP methyl ester carboxylesterase
MKAKLHDVVVVLPGIMGSVLRDAHGHDVWKLSAGSILHGLLGRGHSIKALQLPEGIGDDGPDDGVTATALMPDMHVVPGIWTVNIGYERLVGWFRDNFDVVEADRSDPDRVVNFVQFPYDWRLSNRYNARVLQQAVEPVLERFRARPGNADAKLAFVGHSMGGLVARYYVDVLGGHEVTSKVITLGTPHRGACNALESLVNGVRKGLGPIEFDLTALARSLPALHQLLPEYACIDAGGPLRKTTEVTLPGLDAAMVADAMGFHEELRTGARQHASAYDSHPILAVTQPTQTTARIVGDQVTTIRTIRTSAGDEDQKGDGTVPRLSSAPYGIASNAPILRYVMDSHGALPRNEPALVEMGGLLTGSADIPRPMPVEAIGVRVDDVLLAGEPFEAGIESETERRLVAAVADARTDASQPVPVVARGENEWAAVVPDLAPGFYELRVGFTGFPADGTVVDPFVVLAPE